MDDVQSLGMNPVAGEVAPDMIREADAEANRDCDKEDQIFNEVSTLKAN
jgi:hypothetical protein